VSKACSTRAPASSPTAALLDVLRDFDVEWDDGTTGIAGSLAVFVRTGGLGSGHQLLELLTAEDVVAISFEERRILARTRPSPSAVIGDALRRAPARILRRIVDRRSLSGTEM
jgi:hypothetical protein